MHGRIALATLVALLALASPAAAAWRGGVTLSQTAGVSMDLAMAPSGAAAVAWVDFVAQGDSGEYALRVAGNGTEGRWSEPVTIAHKANGIGRVEVAASRSGDFVLTWAEPTKPPFLPGFPFFSGPYEIKAAVRPHGGTWSAPVTVSGPAPVPTASWLTPAASDGHGAIVWVQEAEDGDRTIHATSYTAGSGWSAAETVSAPGGDWEDAPHIGIDDNGNATMSWLVLRSTPVWSLGWAEHPASGPWRSSPSPLVSGDSGLGIGGDLAVGSGGQVMAAWHADGRVYAASRASGWLATPLGDSSNTYDGDPAVSVDGRGAAAVGWSTGGSVYMSRQNPGGSWAQAEPVTDEPVTTAYAPHIATSSSGATLLAWAAEPGDYDTQRIDARVRGADGEWDYRNTLGVVSPAALDVAMDDEGNGLVGMITGDAPRLTVSVHAYDAAGPNVTLGAVPSEAIVGQTAAFAADAVDRWSPLGTSTWDFGDGGTAQGARVTHVYSSPGSYPLTLTVKDALGNATTLRRTVVVKATDAAPVPVIPVIPVVKPTPTPNPPGPPSKTVKIRFSHRYLTPGVPRAKACRGKVELTLKVGSAVLKRTTVKLDRRCQFGTTFTVTRSRLKGAAKVSVVAHFRGNRYLGRATNVFRGIPVPN